MDLAGDADVLRMVSVKRRLVFRRSGFRSGESKRAVCDDGAEKRRVFSDGSVYGQCFGKTFRREGCDLQSQPSLLLERTFAGRMFVRQI